MALGITIRTGKTGFGGTNAGWRVVKELYEWDCPCGRHVEKYWTKCPECGLSKPPKLVAKKGE